MPIFAFAQASKVAANSVVIFQVLLNESGIVPG